MKISKGMIGLMFIVCYIFAFLAGAFIQDNLVLDELRKNMEAEGIVFCEPHYPPFGEPYAIPTNLTWEDLGYNGE